MKLVSMFIIALASFANIAFAQTPASSEKPAIGVNLAAAKWTDREKFTVFWLLNTGYGQFWTAFPKEGKFRFNSRDYCEAVPADAKYDMEDGKFVILITRTRPGCGPLKLVFDLATQEGILEVMEDGKFNHLPGRTVSLKD